MASKKVTRTIGVTALKKKTGDVVYMYPEINAYQLYKYINEGYELLGRQELAFKMTEEDFVRASDAFSGKEKVSVEQPEIFEGGEH